VSNEDPNKLGRVTAKVPEVLGETTTGWAWPALPYGGDGEGLFAVPPAGAGVWIEFEAGDVSRPIWTGCWWADGQVPKTETGTTAGPKVKVLRSNAGHVVALDDDGQTISVSDANGSNLVRIKAQAGEVRVEAQTKVVVQAPQIELVEGAAHPLVFGDSLLQYLSQLVTIFNTHLHAGELALGVLPVTPAPPATPLNPPTPDLLSVKVKTG
jgi:uncharacterized protein involved in type VI secretion and phage assembly